MKSGKWTKEKQPFKGRSSQRGSILASMAVLFTLSLTALGFLSADIWHGVIVRQQLANACDAAGLATAAALASSSYPSLVANVSLVGAPNIPTTDELKQSRKNAANIGFQIFTKNTVCGHSLANARLVTSAFDNSMGNNQSEVKIDFYDQTPNGSSVPDQSAGKHVVVSAQMAVSPLFDMSILGRQFTVQATGRSATAKFDMAFCLDNSASMNADTITYIVRREWQALTGAPPSQGSIVYTAATLTDSSGAPAPNPNLLDTSVPGAWRPAGTENPFYLDGTNSVNFSATLRGPSDQGSLPGNYNAITGSYTAPVSGSPTFTDLIVLPSGNDGQNNQIGNPGPDSLGTFSTPVSYTYNGTTFKFPNAATMVEASRGNLESDDRFYNQYIKPLKLGVTPQANYKLAYQAYALANSEPYHSEIVQVSNFFTLMNDNTDAHICLIPFSDGAGTPQGQPGTVDEYSVGKAYDPVETPAQPEIPFPFVQVPLNMNGIPNQVSVINQALLGYHIYGGTQTDQGLAQAVANLTTDNQTRLGAKRFAMLLSDGEPTSPQDLSFDQAQLLGKQGIPIFSIAFLHGGAVAEQAATAFMSSVASECASKGGVGSQSFTLTEGNMAQLQQTCRYIAHQYVTLE